MTALNGVATHAKDGMRIPLKRGSYGRKARFLPKRGASNVGLMVFLTSAVPAEQTPQAALAAHLSEALMSRLKRGWSLPAR